MKHKTYNIKQKGASLLLVLLVLVAVLAIALGIVTLMVGELKISQEVPKSLKAYYAAEAGIERALYDLRKLEVESNFDECSEPLSNESSYGVVVKVTGSSTTITSTGCYKDVRRAIDVSWEL